MLLQDVFCRVVELSSFRRAAEQLGMPVATVSHQVQTLEKRLGSQLLTRSTRKVEPTPEGLAYYQRIAPLLEGLQEAEALLQHLRREPEGQLNVSAPASVVRAIIAPAIEQFVRAHPKITLRFVATDTLVHLADEGLDCVIRAAAPNSDGLVARSLASIPQFFAASPRLIERLGMPQNLGDLSRLPFINYGARQKVAIANIQAWHGTQKERFQASARISVDDGDAYLAFAREGWGVVQAPPYDLNPHLRSGELALLMPEWQGPPIVFFAVYARGRQLLPRVRVFVDWVEQLLQQPSVNTYGHLGIHAIDGYS